MNLQAKVCIHRLCMHMNIMLNRFFWWPFSRIPNWMSYFNNCLCCRNCQWHILVQWTAKKIFYVLLLIHHFMSICIQQWCNMTKWLCNIIIVLLKFNANYYVRANPNGTPSTTLWTLCSDVLLSLDVLFLKGLRRQVTPIGYCNVIKDCLIV